MSILSNLFMSVTDPRDDNIPLALIPFYYQIPIQPKSHGPRACMSVFHYLSRVVRKPTFCICVKTKTQISFAVTAKLISAFVFATQILQLLYFLNPEFQVSNHFLWLYSPVCVGPDRKPRRPVFSERGSFTVLGFKSTLWFQAFKDMTQN